jgi:hypothetical protein
VLFPIAEQPACSHDQPLDQQQQQQKQQHHSLLGFSFPSAGVSEVLSLAGPTFRQVALPGLQQGSASLLLAGLPGGWLLQVRRCGAPAARAVLPLILLHALTQAVLCSVGWIV